MGLRAASVPMLAALSAWLLFEASSAPSSDVWFWFVAGVALGVSLYTYPAARTLPIVCVLFFAFYSLHSLASSIVRCSSRSLTALVVVAPLAYTIATLPEADVRLQQLGGPVQEALNGNVEPVLRYTLATLGMFNVAGDPIARYNLPGRPVFDLITGILFLLGLLIALRQWREPRNLFALIWLPIGLLPSMLSDSAPSFLRASASLPVAFLFPALAVDWLLASRPPSAATGLPRQRFIGRSDDTASLVGADRFHRHADHPRLLLRVARSIGRARSLSFRSGRSRANGSSNSRAINRSWWPPPTRAISIRSCSIFN